jgi:hypothetical protein
MRTFCPEHDSHSFQAPTEQENWRAAVCIVVSTYSAPAYGDSSGRSIRGILEDRARNRCYLLVIGREMLYSRRPQSYRTFKQVESISKKAHIALDLGRRRELKQWYEKTTSQSHSQHKGRYSNRMMSHVITQSMCKKEKKKTSCDSGTRNRENWYPLNIRWIERVVRDSKQISDGRARIAS